MPFLVMKIWICCGVVCMHITYVYNIYWFSLEVWLAPSITITTKKRLIVLMNESEIKIYVVAHLHVHHSIRLHYNNKLRLIFPIYISLIDLLVNNAAAHLLSHIICTWKALKRNELKRKFLPSKTIDFHIELNWIELIFSFSLFFSTSTSWYNTFDLLF